MTDINTPIGWDERLNSIMEQINQLYQFIEKMQINYKIFDTEPGDGVMLIE